MWPLSVVTIMSASNFLVLPNCNLVPRNQLSPLYLSVPSRNLFQFAIVKIEPKDWSMMGSCYILVHFTVLILRQGLIQLASKP